MNRLFIASLILLTAVPTLFSSCKKDNDHNDHPPVYSADVLDKWMTLQMRLMRNATGIPNHGFARYYAYTGVAAVEALAPAYSIKAWRSKWNGLTGLPNTQHGKKYYLPANVNAAMAAANKAFFPNASAVDKAAIDSLEAALTTSFLTTQSHQVINTSADYGKAVATAIFNWAEGDGYKNANNPYTVPVGPGLWKPTPGAFAPPATPYWGQNRTVISGSTTNTGVLAPVTYSTETSSAFYNMVKEVYDVSQTLTDDQKAMAIFWRDVPGATSPGHWLSIVQQVVRKKQTDLYKTAEAYALTGAAINDALITCFKSKYQYNLVRPVTYIREVMGHSNWNSFIATPAHPEYVSAHSSLSAAAAAVMEKLFGNSGSFTDHTYDYLGMPARTYNSFMAIAAEAGLSRLYGGIHYRISIDAGLKQGKKVAENIFSHHSNRNENGGSMTYYQVEKDRN